MSLCYTAFQVIAEMFKTAVFTTIMNVVATTVTTTNTIINFRLLCVAVEQQFLHDWSSWNLLQVGWEWAV
jgi:hypothetical protein